MIRTQIQLPDQVADRLRRMAENEHVSMAALIRQAVDFFFAASAGLDSDERYTRAAAAAGSCASGRVDLASEHDTHFVEAART